ncbi:MAG: hypothetical protein JXC32_22570, partial [Anaerolineae bacterium]|nr:hypothetical protein [Anaerolineae bacterium]
MVSTTETGGVPALAVRGYLLHITHYDPRWNAAKAEEQPFDLALGLDVVDAMAGAGLNCLVVDCADGVRYASHPELARHYSVPMATLVQLTARAREHGIEVVPKLNFAQSGLHRHNHWFRPHNDLFDSDRYWALAFEVIDELINVVQPSRFFHVGMDEDHWRSYDQYVAAIQTLHGGLAKRGLRTLIWNDSACLWPQAAIHRDKSLAAEARAPKEVVHIVWDYNGADEGILSRVKDAGFDLWGAPGHSAPLVARMVEALHAVGGSGVLLTRWIPCVEANREALVG